MTNRFKQLGAALVNAVRSGGAQTHALRGIRVALENTRPDIDTARVLARLDEALGLIETWQPWRFAHLRRDLRQIWIVRYPCRGAYVPSTQTCITELTFLARTDITAAPVAASILHEGMHARIHRMARNTGSYNSAREERLCRRAELEFGLALPAALGDPVVQRARASLLLADQDVAPAIHWNIAQQRQHAVDLAAADALAMARRQPPR